MSTSERTDALRTAATTDPTTALRYGIESLAAGAAESVRLVAFLLAAALPLTYLPLVAAGLVGDHFLTFAGLLALHAVTILVGHGYGSE